MSDNAVHAFIALVDRIPWAVWAVIGVLGGFGTIRLVLIGMGYH